MGTERAEPGTAAPAATWSVPESPPDPNRHNRALLIALLVGVGLLWPLPVGGALLMVSASFGLVISWETDLSGAALTPALVEPVVPRPALADPNPLGSF